jgi:signal transduction histidine kinase
VLINRRWLTLLCTVLLLPAISSDAYSSPPTANAGTIDLSEWRFEEQGSLKLTGEWRFLWREFHFPSDRMQPEEWHLIQVPSIWNGQTIDNTKLEGFGYSTYRLTLLLANDRPSLHLTIPEINMAYKLWANGEVIASSGEIGTDEATAYPRSMVKIAKLPGDSRIELVLQVANFYHTEGGIPRAIEINKSSASIFNFEFQKFVNLFTIGALCIVALHYFALYLGRREEPGNLLYALLAILFLLRVLAVSKLPYLLIDHDHIISTRISYITMFLLPTVYLMFLRSLFPNEVSRVLAVGLLVVGSICSLLTLFTEAAVFTMSRDFFSNIILLTLIYTMYAVVMAVIRKREDALLVFGINALFAAAGINDTLLYQQLISSNDLSQYGFLVLIFGHAVVLGRRMNRAYYRENEARTELASFAESLQLRIDERTAELATANEAKSRFLAGASHDLKQPIHALSLYAQMLESSIRKGNSPVVVENIHASLSSLETLLDDLVKVSQLEAGVIEPNIRPVSLQQCFDSLKDEFTIIAQDKGLDIRLVETSTFVATDPDLLSRIVRNLASNAIKYTPQGKVLIGCRRRADHILIQVFDTGSGIDRKDIRSIFDEFTRTNTTDAAGTGLGLSIAKGLSEALDHEISVVSIPGKGSCFSLAVKRAERPTTLNDVNLQSIEHGTANIENLTIVLIEDDDKIRQALAEIFADWHCSVSSAANLREALAACAAMDCAPDLIVSDYHLQNELGTTVIHNLHQEIGFAVPSIIITADRGISQSHVHDLPYTTLLYKPLELKLLQQTIATMLAQYANES